jgi:hypothetical protein
VIGAGQTMPENVTTTVSAIETSRRLTIEADVAGAEPLKLEHGKARFLPEKVVLEVTQDVGELWKPRRLKVNGPNVKADGSTGANQHENTYHYWGFRARQGWSGEVPEWLLVVLADQLNALNVEAGASGSSAVTR